MMIVAEMVLVSSVVFAGYCAICACAVLLYHLIKGLQNK